MSIVTKVRAVILETNKLLAFRLHEAADYFSLPGGHIDIGETIESALERELIEETGVRPVLADLIIIHQLVSDKYHAIEFFYTVTNTQDYLDIDLTKASHAHEIIEAIWLDLDDLSRELRPNFLRSELKQFLEIGPKHWQMKNIVSPLLEQI